MVPLPVSPVATPLYQDRTGGKLLEEVEPNLYVHVPLTKMLRSSYQ